MSLSPRPRGECDPVMIDCVIVQEFAVRSYPEVQYMENLSNNNRPANSDNPIPLTDIDKPIPLGNSASSDSPGVSRAPLNLGGGASPPAPAAKPVPAAKPTPRIVPPTPIAKKPAAAVASAGRITGIKTFFTKLHPGALEFLDEQITRWLKDNPQVNIKHTNAVTGDIQSKKTEPNIIITVWY